MHADVEWENGMEGGFVHGHDAVRSYWTRQWQVLDPTVEPIAFAEDDTGRIVVTVHQIVRDQEHSSSIDISSTSIRDVMGSSVEWRLPRFKQQSTDAIRSRIEIGIPPEVTPL